MILLPLLYQAVLLGVLLRRQRVHTQAQERAVHTKDVLLQVDRIYAGLLRLHGDLRGFALTGNEEFLTDPVAAAAQVDADFRRLENLIADNPAQSRRLAALERDVRARDAWHAEVYRLLRAGDAAEARRHFATLEGKHLLDAARVEIDAMRQEEETLDARRLAELRRSTETQDWLLGAGLVLSIGIGAGVTGFYSRGIARRIALLAENVQRIARGETLPPPMGGSDELAALDLAFHDTAEELAAAQRTGRETQRTIEKRNAELLRANRDLDQKNTENEMFVYSVSHDLRSPLVNLQGFSKELGASRDDLLRLTAGLLDDAARARMQTVLERDVPESIHYIQTAVTRLSAIIDALLRLSRAGRIEYEPTAVELAPVIARILTAMRGSIAARGAEISVKALPPAWGDATALEQAFANLIGNAVNYLDPSRPGHIEIGALETPPPGCENLQVYFVKDNGLGIAEAYLGKVFAVFQRLHPKAAPGEGIGLALVRRMIERHGGKVWVESVEKEGSTFFLALPDRAHSPLVVAPRKESIKVARPTAQNL